MAVNPELTTADTPSSWRSSTCELFIPSRATDGRIKLPILKSWTEPTHPPSPVTEGPAMVIR